MTSEPIEIVLVLCAGLAFAASSLLCWSAWQTASGANDKCEAVRMLAWLRVRNELIRGLIVLLVLSAGLIQVFSPPPLQASPARPWLQAVWVLIALKNLLQSVWNEISVRRVMALIERERAAGRMR